MKAFIQTFLIGISLFFAAGNSLYAFDLSTQTDRAEAPASKHQFETGHVNDQALSLVEFVLQTPEPSLQPKEESGAGFFFQIPGYSISEDSFYPNSEHDAHYISASALIIPGLSSLKLIFPFHLFP